MITTFADKILNGLVNEVSFAVTIIEHLRDEGYGSNFKVGGNCLVCLETSVYYRHLEFTVDEIYKVNGGIEREGLTIFALTHRDVNVKGILSRFDDVGVFAGD